MWPVLVIWTLVSAQEEAGRTTLKWENGRYGLVTRASNDLESGTVLYATLPDSLAPELFTYKVEQPDEVTIELVTCAGAARLVIPPEQVDSPVTYELSPTKSIAHFYKKTPGLVQFSVQGKAMEKYRLAVQSHLEKWTNDRLHVEFIDNKSVEVMWYELEMVDGSTLPSQVTYHLSTSHTHPPICSAYLPTAPDFTTSTTDLTAILPINTAYSSLHISILAVLDTPAGPLTIPYLQTTIHLYHWTLLETGLTLLIFLTICVVFYQICRDKDTKNDFKRLD